MQTYTTQMDAARKGIITPEMKIVAQKEKMTEEKSLNTLIRINKKTPIMVVGDQAGSESFKSLNTVEFDQYSMGAELAQKLLADNNGTLSGKKIGIYCENTESDACKKRIDGIKDTLAESGWGGAAVL